MELQEFKKLLDIHDWFYMMSDSMKVFDKGEQNERKLIKIANENGQEFINLLNKYIGRSL